MRLMWVSGTPYLFNELEVDLSMVSPAHGRFDLFAFTCPAIDSEIYKGGRLTSEKGGKDDDVQVFVVLLFIGDGCLRSGG